MADITTVLAMMTSNNNRMKNNNAHLRVPYCSSSKRTKNKKQKNSHGTQRAFHSQWSFQHLFLVLFVAFQNWFRLLLPCFREWHFFALLALEANT